MARYTDANCRLCRREGQKLFLKGERCYSPKCALERRAFPPGQNGQGRRSKTSEYGLQLREKQKTKRFYGLQETQFRNLFDKAARKQGITGENLLIRQLVVHGHFRVNGKKVTIPSYTVKAGDVITVKEKSQSSPKFKEVKDMTITVPSWMSVDVQKLEGKVLQIPTREEIDTPISEHLIVELYSK